MKKVLALLLVLSTLAFAFCACAKEDATLQGDWSYELAGVEIYGMKFADTTVELRAGGELIETCNYTDNGDGTLSIENTVSSYKIKGNKMTINWVVFGSSDITLTKK